MTNWYEGPLASFDTETTGVDVEHDRIVNAALVVQESAGGPVRRRDWAANTAVRRRWWWRRSRGRWPTRPGPGCHW
jgi:hypothetical protein